MRLDVINWISALDWTGIFNIALQAVGLMALVSSQTANKSDDAIVDAIYKAINFLGGNFGKATNK